jgi:hypothetical protein
MKTTLSAQRESVITTLIRRDINAADKVLDIAEDPKTDRRLKVQIYLHLLEYCDAKKRSVEVTGAGGGPIEANVSIRELLLSRINSIAARAIEG